ncbi:MAG: hypothetical protein ACLFT6_00840 [Bacteroidales bacterium]
MPYRRLPNTDKSRLRALKNAHTKGKELPPFKLAFTQESLQRLSSFLPKYEKAIREYHDTYKIQTKNHKEYSNKVKKVKLYISHFIKVLNMSVIRGEMPPNSKKYYGLDENSRKVPSLNSEQDLLEWGQKLIDGENQRKIKGLPPVTNPTIAVVKVHYDKFVDAYRFQKQLQENHARSAETIQEFRKEADNIILNIWNEVEKTFEKEPEDIKREKASEYGVVYVYRKNELGRINLFGRNEQSFIF